MLNLLLQEKMSVFDYVKNAAAFKVLQLGREPQAKTSPPLEPTLSERRRRVFLLPRKLWLFWPSRFKRRKPTKNDLQFWISKAEMKECQEERRIKF